MVRASNFLLVGVALASAYVLYATSFSTRRLEAEVHAKERALEKLEADIDLLRAERAWLARPERIEPLARMQGLGPASHGQTVSSDAVFERLRSGSGGTPR